MDFPELQQYGRPSSKPEIQDPRPPPLGVRKDSHKIGKPPIAPNPVQHRQPIIIYSLPPKVIHVHRRDFKSIVQRLTGYFPSSSSSSVPSSSRNATGDISSAARVATIQNTVPTEAERLRTSDPGMMERLERSEFVERNGSFPAGILSPIPSSLPPISPDFFAPEFDPNSMRFLNDSIPTFHGRENCMEGTFVPSSTAPITSPSDPYFDPNSINLLHDSITPSFDPNSINFSHDSITPSFDPNSINFLHHSITPTFDHNSISFLHDSITPSFDPNSINFSHDSITPFFNPNSTILHDSIPTSHGHNNYIEGTLVPCPPAFNSAPINPPSPPSFGPFNQFLGF